LVDRTENNAGSFWCRTTLVAKTTLGSGWFDDAIRCQSLPMRSMHSYG
jgi:hypothetical protein